MCNSRSSAELKQPKTLRKLSDTTFLIVWKDGHESKYPILYLRRLCPCAGCAMERHGGQDVHSIFGPSGFGDTSRLVVPHDIRAVDIQLVGRYAIQFTWSDGHSTGIYSLRPCEKYVRVQNVLHYGIPNETSR